MASNSISTVRSCAAARDPQVAVGEAVYSFPKPGSRDALCLVIGATVHSLNLDEFPASRVHDQQRLSGASPPGAGGVLHFRAEGLFQVG